MSQGRRTQPLPPDWPRVRRRILRRDDYRCYLCGNPATDVDHKVPACLGGTDDDSNLAAICRVCHRRKTAQEANLRHPLHRATKQRPADPHPGLL